MPTILDDAGLAAQVSALKHCVHLVASHGTPGQEKRATLKWLSEQIADLTGGHVSPCTKCNRPVVVADPLASDEVRCPRCKRAKRNAEHYAARNR